MTAAFKEIIAFLVALCKLTCGTTSPKTCRVKMRIEFRFSPKLQIHFLISFQDIDIFLLKYLKYFEKLKVRNNIVHYLYSLDLTMKKNESSYSEYPETRNL